MTTPEQWFNSLPKVTRVYFVGVIGTTLLTTLRVITPYQLFFDTSLVFGKFQIWRLLTTFLYFGNFSINMLINVYVLTSYGHRLEGAHYVGNVGLADYTFLMTFCCTLLLLFSTLMGVPFLGHSVLFAIMYIWSRKSPYDPVSIFGFRFVAWHVPFLFLVLQMLLGGSPVTGIAGILAGHTYHFLVDIVPNVFHRQLLKTPQFLLDYFEAQNVHGRNQGWQRGAGYRLGGN